MRTKLYYLGIFSFVLAFLVAQVNVKALTVKDPSNLVQNTITAREAVSMESHTAGMYQQQLLTNAYQLNATKSLTGLSELTQQKKEASLWGQLKNIDQTLLSNVARSRELNSHLLAQFASSNLSWIEFLKTKQTQSSQRDDALVKQYQANTDALNTSASKRQNIINQLQNSSGQTQALQAVGAAIDVLIGQNQQLISTLSAQGQANMAQTQDQASSYLVGRRSWNAYQAQLKSAAGQAGKL